MELLWLLLAITVGLTLLGFFLDLAFALVVFVLRVLILLLIIPFALAIAVANKLRFGTWDSPDAAKKEEMQA